MVLRKPEVPSANLILNVEYLITVRAAASLSSLGGNKWNIFRTHKHNKIFDQD